MTALGAHGVRAELPPGFEGRIFRRPPLPGEATYTVAHFASFALPPGVGDFGSGAVELMTTRDLFVGLLEYGPESVGQALFADAGMPRAFEPRDFSRMAARDATGVHTAVQRFFVESGRPFTMYVVLGSHLARRVLLPPLRTLLGAIRIEP